MTSKEALTNLKLDVSCRGKLSKFQQHCFDLLEKEFKTPTFEECIKEWEDKGYIISKDLPIDKIGMINNGKNYIYITLKEGQIKCGVDGWISLEELNLLSKTLKALEVEDEKEN